MKTLILVVEDNSTNARLTSGMLEAAGYYVVIAVDGEEGYQAARALSPGLIVADLQMPIRDGLSMLRILQDDPTTNRIPVLVLTAHVMPEHRERAIEAGCSGFIAKPVRFQPFIAEIKRILSDSLTGVYCEP